MIPQKTTKHLRRWGAFPVVLFIVVQAWAIGDTVRPADDGRGTIEIIFRDRQFVYSFNLDRYKPQGDSCVELIVGFRITPGAWARFRYDNTRRWQFENIGYYDSSNRRGSIQVKTVFDEGGHFFKGKIFVGSNIDTSPKIAENTNRSWDVPVSEKPPAPFDFGFERKAYVCTPQPKTTVLVRIFTYPLWYMRRDPQGLNYPELAMFHYGSSVRIPASGSINARGFLMNYWHILHPEELEYSTPKKKK